MNAHPRARTAAAALAAAVERLERRVDGASDGAARALRDELAGLRAIAADVDALGADEELLGRAEAELAATRDRLHAVIDSMPIILWAVDPDGLITLSEGRGLASLGLRPGEIVGLSVYDVYVASPSALDAIRRGLRGEALTTEVEVGGRAWSNRYFPRFAPDGRVVALTGLSLDVTDSKRLQDEAKHLEAQVLHAQKLESLGVLAGGIAHDFNNLLSVILGSVEMATARLEPGSSARKKLEVAERAAVRAAELTHQLLVYAGRSRVRIERVELNPLVTELGQLLATAIGKNARIEYALADGLPGLKADAAQLRQVVMNLITNASDALDGRPGTIRITTGVAPSRETDATPNASCWVFLEVRDDGVGMDEATLARIFDPFFTTKFTGRGLGLAAVAGIIRGHEGRLEVQSRPGQGTCFRVELPCAASGDPKQPPGDEQEVASAPSKPGVTLLLVDDEDDVRAWMREVLEEAGFEVLDAASAESSLALPNADLARIGAAVVDVVMPGLSGHALRKELQARRPDLPVLMVSGFEQESGDPVHDRAAPLLAKPFTAAKLLGAIAALL